LTDADPAVGVGSVHHIVPRFYLRRFADERDQITVVSRITGQRRDAPVDKAHRQKDFYTFVNTDGESDGRVEQLLGLVEGQAATALRNTFHPVFGRWPPMGEHRLELIQFVAFQSLRGRRQRRQMEMIADYAFRFELSHVTKANVPDFLRDRGMEPTPEAVDEALTVLADLDDLEFAPQNNHYIDSMLRILPKTLPILAQRRNVDCRVGGALLGDVRRAGAIASLAGHAARLWCGHPDSDGGMDAIGSAPSAGARSRACRRPRGGRVG
jgi:hypothetical protein